MLIKQLMSQPVAVCYLDDTLNRAAHLMWEFDCGVVPVVDDDGHAVAMLTDRDICMAAYTQGKPLQQIGVTSAMSKTLQFCHPEDMLAVAEQLMKECRVRRLPVLDREDRPIGIISINDLTRAAMGQHSAAAGTPEPHCAESLTRTIAAISAPHTSKA